MKYDKTFLPKKRWINALKLLAKTNRLIESGCTVKYDGEIVSKFILRDCDGISEVGFYPHKNSFWCLGDNDLEADNGIMYDNMRDFNDDFQNRVEIYNIVDLNILRG